MTHSPKKLLPLVAAASIVAPTLTAAVAAPAGAAVKNPQALQAFKKGIRDVARIEGKGATAKRIDVRCVAVPKVGDRGKCTGSFDLVKHGRTAHYVLTAKARTLRISPGAIEYRVASKADKKVQGLPGSTDLAGFLQ
ncbi:MAG TPA: hypothetical protein VFG42_11915 [Baekduia sp.]|uniref:hypothetical protein n=1 Tax=Baekduia sp. TaxID=2600305 RepID=UPI002D778ECD|nr:hypothetical protein [Baekduia sp.]HET6507484.1 hypothetical protein [Baekduia sp.]